MTAECASGNELFLMFGSSRHGTFCFGEPSEIANQVCRRIKGEIDHKLRECKRMLKGSLAWIWRRWKHFDAK
jgi:hypothetical protein